MIPVNGDRRRNVRNDTPHNRRAAVQSPTATQVTAGRIVRERTCAPDSYTSTFTGRQFWPLDPHPEEIDLRDIARALSMQCRWGGHVRTFFSVAQHCVYVAEHLPSDMMLRGLLHDAAEAYLVDVPSPIKKYMHGYEYIEMRLLEVIGQRFGITGLHRMSCSVHEQDGRALATEHRDIRTPLSFWTPPAVSWPERISPWGPEQAEERFLDLAHGMGLQ